MTITQEVVRAEMAYRLERAKAATLAREGRASRRRRPSRLRHWLTNSERRPLHRATPALP